MPVGYTIIANQDQIDKQPEFIRKQPWRSFVPEYKLKWEMNPILKKMQLNRVCIEIFDYDRAKYIIHSLRDAGAFVRSDLVPVDFKYTLLP